MEYKGYKAKVVFDSDANVLFGEVEGLRDVVTFEATNVKDLAKAFRASVEDYLEMCAERGESPELAYSGKFLVRVDPELHRELVAAAALSGKSLNAFAREVLRDSVGGRAFASAAPALAPSPPLPAANVRGVAETRREFRGIHPSQANADFARQLSVWGAGTKDTPASITPARDSNTPSAREPDSSQNLVAA